MATSKPVQDLRPGDRIKAPDGRTATVEIATTCAHPNAVTVHTDLDDWVVGLPCDATIV